jgi:hypothetical protein
MAPVKSNRGNIFCQFFYYYCQKLSGRFFA